MLLGLTTFCCFFFIPAPASAYQWNRVATDTTLTANQLCKTDGANIVCDSTTPTISGNNVGIGTTSPSQNLEIKTSGGGVFLIDGYGTNSLLLASNTGNAIIGQGNVSLKLTTSYGSVQIGGVAGTAAPTTSPTFIVQGVTSLTADLQDWENSSGTVLAEVTASGNVGIGTAAPNGQLDVYSTSGDANMYIESPGASGSAAYLHLNYQNQAYYGIQFQHNGVTDWWEGNWGGASDSLTFYRTNNTTPVLSLATSGLVSIGTTTSSSELNVYGGLSVGTTYVSTTAPTNGAIIQGNVGIGTTSPSYTLQVTQSGSTTSAPSTIGFTTSTSGSATRFVLDQSDAIQSGYGQRTQLGSYYGVEIHGDRVIGTTSPNDKLDVAGAVKVAGTGSEGCTTATMGQMRFNPTYNYMEICQ